MLAAALAVSFVLQEPQAAAPVVVALAPRAPRDGESLRWSPKGATVPLAKDGEVLRGAFALGPADTAPVQVELSRSPGSAHVDRLAVDCDRDGVFGDAERFVCAPKEQRGKWWSSFEATVRVPFGSGERAVVQPYPMSLWFVADPTLPPDAPSALRWSRRGWHQGTFTHGGEQRHVLVTEMRMDGVFTADDAWQLGVDGASMRAAPNRSLGTHAWVGGRAFRATAVTADGSELTLEPFDPGVTEAEERDLADRTKADRAAKRADHPLAFRGDLAAALADAKRDGKRVFVDFVTTWCGPCKEMDRIVYTAADVVAAASGSVIAVQLDGDEQRELVAKYGVKGYPTLLLLDADGAVLRRASGYQGVAAMVRFLGQ